MKVVFKVAMPWPPPNGLMRPSGSAVEVTDDEIIIELRERDLIEYEDQDSPAEPDDVDDGDADSSDEDDEQDAPAEPASSTGKKYPELPKKSAGINHWREYARTNEIDIRGLSEAAEIKGHIMKVVGE